MVSAWLQLGYSSIKLNRTGLRLMDFCYDGWTDRVPQKAPTSTAGHFPDFVSKQRTNLPFGLEALLIDPNIGFSSWVKMKQLQQFYRGMHNNTY
jgi:hypothetical protein